MSAIRRDGQRGSGSGGRSINTSQLPDSQAHIQRFLPLIISIFLSKMSNRASISSI